MTEPEGRPVAPPAVGQPAERAEMRAADADPERVVEQLSQHSAVGRLTLSELEERAQQAYAAKTYAELELLTSDLPQDSTQHSPVASRPRRKVSRWFVSVMGGSHRRGRFRLSGSVTSIAVMGGDTIDLRDAEIDGDEVIINVFALMGGTDIYAPDTVETVVEGFGIMGGNDERGSRRAARPGAPVIRIRA